VAEPAWADLLVDIVVEQLAVVAAQPPRDLEGKIHRVDPKFTSRPSSLAKNPYKSLTVDPDSGCTLWISAIGSDGRAVSFYTYCSHKNLENEII
jgi:hypothetical protein